MFTKRPSETSRSVLSQIKLNAKRSVLYEIKHEPRIY